MAQVESPIIQLRRLSAELRRLRDESAKTQKEVAHAVEWSPSKVNRIEQGKSNIKTSDLIALLHYYGVDRERVGELVEMARGSRRQEWWDEYRPYHTEQFLTFLGLEASAARLRMYQSLLVPGLLQIPEYAEAVLRAYHSDHDEVARSVEVRTKRQALLDAKPGPEVFVVLDEAVIHRWVGGADVMRRQLVRLEELDQRSNIHIQVVPFTRGAHPGMRGSFSVFEFPSDEERYAVLQEHAHQDILVQNNQEEHRKYLDTFLELEEIASSKGDLRKITQPILDRMPESGLAEPSVMKSMPAGR